MFIVQLSKFLTYFILNMCDDIIDTDLDNNHAY